MIYAGFWRRFIAFFIDSCIVQCILFLVRKILPINMTIDRYFIKGQDISESFSLTSYEVNYPQDAESILASLLMIAIVWLYYALFQSSKHQATPGMKLFKMEITDYEGKRISFGQATLRYFASWLSGLIAGIGYIMIAFTPRKQGLHDYIAKTLVMKK